MKVFISSVITGFERFREAAMQGALCLDHQILRAEDYSASPSSSQQVCLAGVRAADVVVLILGERYGYPQVSGLSATHEEYREARGRRPVLVFVQEGVTAELAQEEFIREAQAWVSGQFTAKFKTPEDLGPAVTRALHRHELAQVTGVIDESELLERARTLITSSHSVHVPSLCLAVAGGPNQQVVRPSQLTDQSLSNALTQRALFGDEAVFDLEQGTKTTLENRSLLVSQAQASILLGESGAVRIMQPAQQRRRPLAAELPALIEEEIQTRLVRGLRLAGWILDQVDPLHRVSDIVPVAALVQASFMAWRTMAEHSASPRMMSHSPTAVTSDKICVTLSPARRIRAALIQDTERMAEDMTALLRSQLRP